jgi:hypothetical protein
MLEAVRGQFARGEPEGYGLGDVEEDALGLEVEADGGGKLGVLVP